MSEGFLKAQAAVFAKQAKDADIIITTALIPGSLRRN
jgi:NAD(P) transhydrogenase subunit alpha